MLTFVVMVVCLECSWILCLSLIYVHVIYLFVIQFITHNYERDDGLVRSWIDHVVCTNSFSTLVSDVYRVQLNWL